MYAPEEKMTDGEASSFHNAKLGEFTMVSQPIRLILVDWFVFHFCLGRFPFLFFLVVFIFIFLFF